MRAELFLRICKLSTTGLILTACDGSVEVVVRETVRFAKPFPVQKTELAAFPTRYRGEYAADSTTSFCVGAKAVWQQRRWNMILSNKQFDSLRVSMLANNSVWADKDRLYHWSKAGADSVRISWVQQDTVFTLAGTHAGQLRRFQNHYYLSTSAENTEGWEVERMEFAGGRLVWQALGQDTLRLSVLDTATVHRCPSSSSTCYFLTPSAGEETRRVSHYAGLWETIGTYERR
jgi:hypothetical protein